MYAIIFNLDHLMLLKTYHSPDVHNAYVEINSVFEKNGFDRHQGNVYFANSDKINAVSCVLTVMELSKNNPWFAASMKDIRMLRIEEECDLMPALMRLDTRHKNHDLKKINKK